MTAEPANILTVDVEDYFQVSRFRNLVRPENWGGYPLRISESVHAALDLLEESCTHATFFVLGWIARKRPDLVREIKTRGHEIASHGYAHRLAFEQTEEEFKEDVKTAKILLEDLTGGRVLGYRAPTYSILKAPFAAYDILAEVGYRYDSSVFSPGRCRCGGEGGNYMPYPIECANGRRVLEYPLASAALFGVNMPVGRGGYLRLLPLPLIKAAVRKINLRGAPATMSFHPWELDEHQPRMPVSLKARFCHYLNIHTTKPKVRALCSSFHFGRICDTLDDYLDCESPRRDDT
ncbi:MAG: XrtA system polysaccharide deacetylase [Planctomycetota bacterium]